MKVINARKYDIAHVGQRNGREEVASGSLRSDRRNLIPILVCPYDMGN